MNPTQKKNAIYSLVLITAVLALYTYRNYIQVTEQFFSGTTMGAVVYNVKFIGKDAKVTKAEVDSLLVAFNQSLSTYIPDSEISRFNKSTSLTFESPFFLPVLKRSKEIFEITEGAFDPTVMPLVNAWGFGPQKQARVTPEMVDSLLAFVGFQKISFNNREVRKLVQGVQIDFSAIAKGYAVDVVADLLESKGIKNYMVEIGGEVVCKGSNKLGKPWVIGINDPTYKERGVNALTARIQLSGRALATSGNYENFYMKDGKKYVHTIDPVSGYPIEQNLLSASIFAPDCMTADALATACMVMGVEKAVAMLEKLPEVDAFLVYDEEGILKTYQTPNLSKDILPQQ
jgi:thiamine biosynthesis lipoprotein